MEVRSERGQVTVFLSIILLSVVALAGVLVDVSRIVTAETQVTRAVDSAARSVLAGYSSRLKDEYGLFALNREFENELKQDVESYIRKNLMIGKIGEGYADSKYVDLYDYRIEDISVTPIFNFTENKAVRDQILKYMKYRAPKKVVEGIWDKLSAVKDLCRMSEAYKKKINVDKILGKMDKAQQKLKRNIDGTVGDGRYEPFYICKFNKNGSRNNAANKYADLVVEYRSLSRALNGTETDESIRKRMRAVKNEMETIWRELRYNHTEAFIKPNVEAEKNIKEIMRLGEEASKAIHDLEQYMQNSFKESGLTSKNFKTTVEKDIAELKALILDGKRAEEIISYAVKNSNALKTAASRLDQIKSLYKASDEIMASKNSIIKLLNDGLANYNNTIKYDYRKTQKAEPGTDPRAGAVEAAALKLSEKREQDKDMKRAGIIIEDLPSRRKVESRNFDVEDEVHIKPEEQLSIPAAKAYDGVEYGGDLSSLDKEMNFFNEDEKFSENALNFISSMEDILLKGLAALRDEIYINEYIMGMFKNSVTVLRDGPVEKKDLYLRGVDKSIRDTFFDGEVEYILHGNPSERINKTMTQAQVLLVRFGLNTLHVYSDSKKRELANGIAAAAAGWWTGGAGIPIIANLIMCGWGMGEAVIDLTDLMDGKPVPLYKLAGDWKLDIGLSERGGPKSDTRLSFTYHDYLRLFLLLKNTETVINRMEDLIELNMQKTNMDFKMRDCYMYMRVEAVISMRYFFMTQPFVPERRKTPDGRHRFRVVVYQGYH